jgi:hypothetical protein
VNKNYLTGLANLHGPRKSKLTIFAIIPHPQAMIIPVIPFKPTQQSSSICHCEERSDAAISI